MFVLILAAVGMDLATAGERALGLRPSGALRDKVILATKLDKGELSLRWMLQVLERLG